MTTRRSAEINPRLQKHFASIGDGIFLSVPDSDAGVKVDDILSSPNVILVFGWMGAKLAHLYKYTDSYRQLYPGATQIVVRSNPSFFWSSQKARQARLAPVVEVLEAIGYAPEQGRPRNLTIPITPISKPRILVHALSNGGSYQMVTLGQMLSAQSRTLASLTPSAIVLDSCPGSAGLRTSILAFAMPFRNPVLRYLVAIGVTLSHIVQRLLSLLLRRPAPLEALQLALHVPRVLPWVDARTPRLYVYSRADKLVPWEQVRAHAEKAQRDGIVVRSEVFEESEHVAHARRDPARYWGAVSAVWEEASQVTEQ